MAPDKAYHIKLNGEGYVIQPETYLNESQRAFSARFATGDASYGDLSFWQFLTQEDWKDGEGQETFEALGKYKQSSGWDIRDGKPRLALGTGSVPLTGTPPDFDAAAPEILYDSFIAGAASLNRWFLDGSGWIIIENSQMTNHDFPNWTEHYAAMPQFFTVGTWRFKIRQTKNAVDKMYCHYEFIDDGSSNTYGVRFTGPDMQDVEITKDGVMIATAAYGGGVNNQTEVKITRDISGQINVYKDDVFVVGVLDNEYDTSVQGKFTLVGTDNGVGSGPGVVFIDDVFIPSTAKSSVLGLAVKTVPYNNQIWYCYPTADAPFTTKVIKQGFPHLNIPTIMHINATDIAVMSRDGNLPVDRNSFLLAVSGNTLEAYGPVVSTILPAATFTTTFLATSIRVIDSKSIMVAGTTDTFNGTPAFERFTFSNNSWINPTIKVMGGDGGQEGTLCNWSAVSGSGVTYFATVDMSENLGTVPTRVLAFTSADILALNPTISKTSFVPNFRVRGLFSLSGTVYMFGATINGTISRDSIRNIDGTVVYESEREIDLATADNSVRFNYGVQSIFELHSSVIFLTRSGVGDWLSVMELSPDGSVKEIASFDTDPFANDLPDPLSIIEYSGHFYLIKSNDKAIDRTGDTRGGFTSGPANLSLNMSEFGGNTSLINKTLYAATIELSESIPPGESLIMSVNGSDVATIVNADGETKTTVLTAELTGTTFEPVIRMARASTWSGYLKRITLQYIPTQFKKQGWGMTARATNNIKLINSSKEQRKGEVIFSDLRAAWASNTPVDFTDIDGQTYKVILTNFRARTPIIANERSRREWLVSFELLEV